MRKLGLVILFAAGAAFAKGKEAAPTLMPMSEYQWKELMPGGPQIAVLWGDPLKGGESGFLLKLPAGFTSPPHSHSSTYWAVTVQGVMSHWAVDGGSEVDAKPLPAGSYQMIPAKVKHVSKCAAGADCILFARMTGKFDFKPVEAPKADAGKPETSPARPAAPK